MTDQDIFEALTPIFRSVLANDAIVLKPETSQKDIPKWDSFRYIEIILQVEEAMGVKIRAREANKLANVGELVALIQAKKAAA